jgi:hypothetical protein
VYGRIQPIGDLREAARVGAVADDGAQTATLGLDFRLEGVERPLLGIDHNYLCATRREQAAPTWMLRPPAGTNELAMRHLASTITTVLPVKSALRPDAAFDVDIVSPRPFQGVARLGRDIACRGHAGREI